MHPVTAPLEKLTALLDDIFEAEDSLSGDANVQDLPAEWFSSITLDGTAPQLSPAIIRKLSKYIGQVARPTKRFRLSARENAATGTTPRGKGRVADLDTVILSRILKILERSVKAGDDLDPFHYTAPPNEKNASPRKPKKPKRPKAHEDDEELAEETGEVEMPVDEPPRTPVQDITEGEDDRLSKVLQAAKESVLAADCCVALLASDRLTKQARAISPRPDYHADTKTSCTRRSLLLPVCPRSKINSTRLCTHSLKLRQIWVLQHHRCSDTYTRLHRAKAFKIIVVSSARSSKP